MDRDFERFNGGPTQSRSDRIHVTISRQSVILLNENAYRLIGKPDGVYLSFSRTRDTIAIEPACLPHSPSAAKATAPPTAEESTPPPSAATSESPPTPPSASSPPN